MVIQLDGLLGCLGIHVEVVLPSLFLGLDLFVRISCAAVSQTYIVGHRVARSFHTIITHFLVFNLFY